MEYSLSKKNKCTKWSPMDKAMSEQLGYLKEWKFCKVFKEELFVNVTPESKTP